MSSIYSVPALCPLCFSASGEEARLAVGAAQICECNNYKLLCVMKY